MVKIENKNSFKIGDKVWWFDSWGTLRWGIIYIQDTGRQGCNL